MYLEKGFEISDFKVFETGEYSDNDLIPIYIDDESISSGTILFEQIFSLAPKIILSKLEFRNLFLFSEKLFIDNYESSTLPDNVKQILRTMIKDMDSAENVDLSFRSTIEAICFLNQIGLISISRVNQIKNGIK